MNFFNESHMTELMHRGFYSTAFQPIVDGKVMRIMGFEALLRGPEGSPFATPGRIFSSVGELSPELLLRLDMACIGSAVRTSRGLPGSGLIFINILTPTLLQMVHSLEGFLSLLEGLRIAPSRIVFELSESMGAEMVNEVARCVERFRRHGFRFALDDIGIRSPYLYHLLWLEPEFVKLDRSFIQGVDSFDRKRDLVCAVSSMAEQLGAKLIAEGVETEGEFQTVRSADVTIMQGFHFGRPAPAEHFQDLSVTASPQNHPVTMA